MTIWLKQSTAATVVLGPFIDDADGKTAETALTLSQADIRLSKNGGSFAQKNDSNAASHMENGYYSCGLNTTDTGTLGVLNIAVNESGALPVWETAMILPANVWDSFFGADKLQVHVDEMTAGIITAAVIADGAIDAGALAADTITAAKLASDVTTELQSGLATAAALSTVAGYLDTEVAAILAAVDTEIAAIISTLATLATSSQAGTIIGYAVTTDSDLSTLLGRLTDLRASYLDNIESTALGGYVQTAVEDIVGAAGASLGSIPWNAAWDAEVQSEAADALAAYDGPTHAELTAALAAADDAVLAAVAALNNLSAAQVNAEVDTALADVGVTTTVTGRIDAAISTRLASASYTAPPSAASIRTEMDTNSTKLADILTDTAEIGAAGAGLSAVPWNAAWDAEVQSEAADALVAYDPPTKAELDSAVAPLATAAALDAVDNFVDTEMAAVKAVTDKLDTAMELDGAVYRFTTNALEQAPVGEGGTSDWTAGEREQIRHRLGIDGTADAPAATPSLATAAAVAALNDLSAAEVNAEVDAALADVGLTTTVTGRIDVAISSRGTGTALDAAGVRSAIGMASANLDTQLGDLPTNAELATSQAAADDATLAAIAALNNLSAAQVNAEVDAALADYDPPTKAELDAAVAPLATAAALATVDGIVDDILVDTGTTLPAAIDAVDNFVDTEMAAANAVLAKLDTAVELDGAVYRFTTNALEQAPTGGGGSTDWTSDEREQIRHRLGIDGTATAPSTGTPTLALESTLQARTPTSGSIVKLETMLDGTGGNVLHLKQLRIEAEDDDSALYLRGSGAGSGIDAEGGATGMGMRVSGGATSGHGILASAQSGGSSGLYAVGDDSSGAGISANGGSGDSPGISANGSGSGAGMRLNGGSGTDLLLVDGNAVGLNVGVKAGGIADTSFAAGAIDANALAASAGAELADAVWDEALSGHATAGSAGAKLTAIDSTNTQTAAAAALAAYDPPTHAELTSAVSPLATAASIAALDDLSSAQVQAAAAAAMTAIGLNSTVVGRIDVATSTRLATAGYTAPDNAGIDSLETMVGRLNGMIEPGSPSYRFTTYSLSQAPTGGGSGAVWEEDMSVPFDLGTAGRYLQDIHAGVNTSGPGAEEVDYYVREPGGDPIDDVEVWVTISPDGSDVVARGTTNLDGLVTFYLDAGTYYAWRQKNGVAFSNPASFAVGS